MEISLKPKLILDMEFDIKGVATNYRNTRRCTRVLSPDPEYQIDI